MANPPADALQGAITHDNQTEGYYIVSGGGTAFIDGKVVNGRRNMNNPDGGPNGPGCGGGVAVGLMGSLRGTAPRPVPGRRAR